MATLYIFIFFPSSENLQKNHNEILEQNILCLTKNKEEFKYLHDIRALLGGERSYAKSAV